MISSTRAESRKSQGKSDMGTRLPTLTLSGEYLQPDIANRRGIDASVLQRQNQLVVFINGDIEFVALSVETRKIIVRPQHLTCAFHAASLTFGDRKSTRLNSSHVAISYAVFCLK